MDGRLAFVSSVHENGGFRGREAGFGSAVHENGGFRGREVGFMDGNEKRMTDKCQPSPPLL